MLCEVVGGIAPHVRKYFSTFGVLASPLCPHKVSQCVVSVDYNTFEAIRGVGGKEERAKLVAGGSTFAQCTWLDGTSWVSNVPNLMLTIEKAPLRKITRIKKKPAAAVVLKNPAGAKKGGVEDSDLEEEGEEEGEEEDQEEDLEEEEEQKEGDALVDDGPAKKKAKTDEEDCLQHRCPYIYIYI